MSDVRNSQAAIAARYRPAMRDDMEHIGARIRALREHRGESQSVLAAALEIDESAISKIETGRRGLAAGELAVLSQHFAVSSDEILFPERGHLTGALLRGASGPDAERVKARVEQAFADLRYVRSLVES